MWKMDLGTNSMGKGRQSSLTTTPETGVLANVRNLGCRAELM